MKALGKVLKAARKRAGYKNQSALAAKMGVHLVTVTNWERGLRTPNNENLATLSTLLDVPLEELQRLAPVPETPFPAKGESGVTQVTAASVTSRDRLAAQTSPTGEAEAKASEGEGRMGRWAWIDEELAAFNIRRVFLSNSAHMARAPRRRGHDSDRQNPA